MSNKKEVLFYTDRAYNLRVHPKFIESWRKIPIDGMENKVWEYLDKHGHFGVKKSTPQYMLPTKSTKRGGHRPVSMKHNEHVKDQLIDYSNPTASSTK